MGGDEMLAFETKIKPKIAVAELEKMHIADALDDDRFFKIFIDGQLLYDQSHFSMWEFAQYSLKWIKSPNENFIYNSIESDENPMLSFVRSEAGWKVYSVWQEFECNNVFSSEEVVDFIKSIISQVAE